MENTRRSFLKRWQLQVLELQDLPVTNHAVAA